jgi:hypothetical protein
MPKSNIVDEGSREKESEDFDSIFNDIVEKTDEEIREDEQKAEKDAESNNSDDSHGDGTGDSSEPKAKPEADSDAQSDNTDSTTNEATGLNQDSATDSSDGSDLSMRVEYLENENSQLKADLKKERQRTSSWDGRIKAANAKVKSLEEQNAKLVSQLGSGDSSDSTEASSDDEVMAKFKETFPELVEIIEMQQRRLAGIEDKIKPQAKDSDESGSDSTEDLDGDSTSDTDTKPSTTDVDAHMSAIRDAHPELDEILGTGVLLTWIHKSGPSTKPMLLDIYNGKNGQGSAKQVISMITNFKNQTGWLSQLDKTEQAKTDKLNALKESEGESAGPKSEGPDKNDFGQGAKDAGLV